MVDLMALNYPNIENRKCAIPEEFCNVTELLSQLEMRRSLAEISMRKRSYDYSVNEEIQEVNSSERASSSVTPTSSDMAPSRVSAPAYS